MLEPELGLGLGLGLGVGVGSVGVRVVVLDWAAWRDVGVRDEMRFVVCTFGYLVMDSILGRHGCLIFCNTVTMIQTPMVPVARTMTASASPYGPHTIACWAYIMRPCIHLF